MGRSDFGYGSSGYFLHCMDPGGDTGLSLFHVRPDGFDFLAHATVAWRPEQGETPVNTLHEWLYAYPGPHHLLYENFHVRNTSSAASTDLTALSVIAAVEETQRKSSAYARVFKQEPVKGKRMATDAVLEALGLHLGHAHRNRHVRDANRHFVTHLAKLGYLPVCRIAFPPRSVRIQPRP